MNRPDSRRFTAQLSDLKPALAFAEAFCITRGVGREDAMRLNLVLEELFTNTVTHGHGGGGDAPVHVQLRIDDDLVLDYADEAPPFDPRQAASPEHLDGAADERPVGGLGLHLVTQYAKQLDWHHDGQCNRVHLVLARGALKSG